MSLLSIWGSLLFRELLFSPRIEAVWVRVWYGLNDSVHTNAIEIKLMPKQAGNRQDGETYTLKWTHGASSVPWMEYSSVLHSFLVNFSAFSTHALLGKYWTMCFPEPCSFICTAQLNQMYCHSAVTLQNVSFCCHYFLALVIVFSSRQNWQSYTATV